MSLGGSPSRTIDPLSLWQSTTTELELFERREIHDEQQPLAFDGVLHEKVTKAPHSNGEGRAGSGESCAESQKYHETEEIPGQAELLRMMKLPPLPADVNPKQYRRIIARRHHRIKLQRVRMMRGQVLGGPVRPYGSDRDRRLCPDLKPVARSWCFCVSRSRAQFKHASRQEHARRRQRGPQGRFLSAAEREAMEGGQPAEDLTSSSASLSTSDDSFKSVDEKKEQKATPRLLSPRSDEFAPRKRRDSKDYPKPRPPYGSCTQMHKERAYNYIAGGRPPPPHASMPPPPVPVSGGAPPLMSPAAGPQAGAWHHETAKQKMIASMQATAHLLQQQQAALHQMETSELVRNMQQDAIRQNVMQQNFPPPSGAPPASLPMPYQRWGVLPQPGSAGGPAGWPGVP